MHRVIRALVVLLLLLAGPASAQNLGGSSASPGLKVFTAGGGAGVTALTCTDQFFNAVTGAGVFTCASIDANDLGTTLVPQFARVGLGVAADAANQLTLPATGVIEWDGDFQLTGSANTLTLSGANLALTAANVTVGSAQGVISSNVLYLGGQAVDIVNEGITDARIRVLTDATPEFRMDSAGFIGFSSGAPNATTLDSYVQRDAAGTWALTNNLIPNGAILTAGSGTGVTVNAKGFVRTLVYKVTVLSTNCVAAAVTCDLTIVTLPAKTFIRRVWADLTTTYACTAVCTTATLSATLGTTAGGSQLLASWDLDAATGVFGDADAELGTSLTAAARTANGALIDGVLGSWTGTTTVTYRITSGTGNLGDGAATNLSQGTVVFYLTTDVHP